MILRLGRSPGERNGYPLQYSCLDNSMDRGAWRAIWSMGSQESDTTERLTLSHYISFLKTAKNKQNSYSRRPYSRPTESVFRKGSGNLDFLCELQEILDKASLESYIYHFKGETPNQDFWTHFQVHCLCQYKS